jgi:hypothetical protein
MGCSNSKKKITPNNNHVKDIINDKPVKKSKDIPKNNDANKVNKNEDKCQPSSLIQQTGNITKNFGKLDTKPKQKQIQVSRIETRPVTLVNHDTSNTTRSHYDELYNKPSHYDELYNKPSHYDQTYNKPSHYDKLHGNKSSSYSRSSHNPYKSYMTHRYVASKATHHRKQY